MWLIETTTLQLEYFTECPSKQYAVLSHTWEDEELTFNNFHPIQSRLKKGFWKVQQCCKQAKSEGLRYAWVDTCCIDKTSSADLSEAINSMFSWYQSARTCYVYMADVAPAFGSDVSKADFPRSRWFTRGWTLQELLAPPSVMFFDSGWTALGSKHKLAAQIAAATRIDRGILTGEKTIDDYSVAQRMSWAAKRITTRIEDTAYSLLGIFNVNMPLLYGEGAKAFKRLQETIIQVSDDETIFAWSGISPAGSGLLAPSPDHFIAGGDIERDVTGQERPPYAMTNRGLSIQCRLQPYAMNVYVTPLLCCRPSAGVYRLRIFIARTGIDSQYRRVSVGGNDFHTSDKAVGYLAPDRWNHWNDFKGHTVLLYIPHETRSPLLSDVKQPVIHFSSIRIEPPQPYEAFTCLKGRFVQEKQVLREGLNTGEAITAAAKKASGRTVRFQPRAKVSIALESLEAGCKIELPQSSTQLLPITKISIGFDREYRPMCFLSTNKSIAGSLEEWQEERKTFWHDEAELDLIDSSPLFGPWPIPENYPPHLRPHCIEKKVSELTAMVRFRGHRVHGLIIYFLQFTSDMVGLGNALVARLSMYPRRKEENANGLQWNVELEELLPQNGKSGTHRPSIAAPKPQHWLEARAEAISMRPKSAS